MQVERNELVDLLRSRYSEQTAQRAEGSLPQSIDLDRDRALLQRCGIDPNVLAVVLSASSSRNEPTGRRCPRCQTSFASSDQMLDHLNRRYRASAAPSDPVHRPAPDRVRVRARGQAPQRGW